MSALAREILERALVHALVTQKGIDQTYKKKFLS